MLYGFPEMEMPSFWWNFHHWFALEVVLLVSEMSPFWWNFCYQLNLVMMEILLKWHFHFSIFMSFSFVNIISKQTLSKHIVPTWQTLWELVLFMYGTQGWCSVPTHVWALNGFKSLRQSDAYMPHQTRPSLFQIMACYLLGTKSLSETLLVYCQ